jgi:hypothetical protein
MNFVPWVRLSLIITLFLTFYRAEQEARWPFIRFQHQCLRKRLKAKKNLDDPGRSKTKSFLSFSDSKIVSNIAMLGVSIGKDIGKNIEDMKETELDRLLQASYNTPNQEDMSQNVDDETSEAGSDVGLD